jgi:aryl-alcohol dehydrogenase-like predicted oxidoreductase
MAKVQLLDKFLNDLKGWILMKYRKLGSSGLMVSAIGLGGNPFGQFVDEVNSVAVIDHALDMGITFIDTADLYGAGKSEEVIGKALKKKRSQVILATKFGVPIAKGPNKGGGSRYYIINALEASLRRLQTDYIDLYYLHLPDPSTPIEETLRALDDLVRAGKVRYIGCSNLYAWELSEALWTSKTKGLASFVVIEVRYNILERQIEWELYPYCQAKKIGVVPWGPLSGGFLTGKYRKAEMLTIPRMYEYMMTDENWEKLNGLKDFAAQQGHTVGELAIAWLLARDCVSSVIAGATTTEQVAENVTAAEWELTTDEIIQIEKICDIKPYSIPFR